MLAEAQPPSRGPVLLTGATGCIGSHLFPALLAAGYDVRCSSRDPDRARRSLPDRNWVRLDVDQPSTFASLRGCRTIFYLVHHMGGGAGYAEREARAAVSLRDAAAAAGVERIVYLGGVAPGGPASDHLRSRLETGALLRQGPTPTIELRAGMIIGEGSASFQIVRDLAARLPAMLLPRWLNNRSSPVAIDDVVAALMWAASTAGVTGWYDVPGPEVLTHRELITRVAIQLGKRPAMLEIPVVTPALSSYWIALVTRIGLDLARELVQGLQSDLVPDPSRRWGDGGTHVEVGLEQAVQHALAAEAHGGVPAAPTRARLVHLGRGYARVAV